MNFLYKKIARSRYASFDIGRLTFGTGFFPFNFSIGLQITRHTITWNFGFIWFDVDWFAKDIIDFDWEDTNYDDEDDDLSGKP